MRPLVGRPHLEALGDGVLEQPVVEGGVGARVAEAEEGDRVHRAEPHERERGVAGLVGPVLDGDEAGVAVVAQDFEVEAQAEGDVLRG